MVAVAVAAFVMEPQVQNESFRRSIRKEVSGQYVVSLPDGYDREPKRRWPVMLFLHGAGERGDDLAKVKVHGPLKEIAKGRKLPMIVVAPQCPENEWWDTDTLIGLLDHVERKYRVDRRREYVTGLSMGGYGTWALAIAQPSRFAAIAPVCGGGVWRQAHKIKAIPTWVTHGDKDAAVPLQESVDMVEALRRAGANPRFDIIAGGQHDVWTDFYARDDFYTWLLSHQMP